MRRLLALFLAVSFMLLLWGCDSADSKDQSLFYYCRAAYSYGSTDAVIATEERDIAGHAGDLNYLLSLYLMGPLDEELASPFPGRTQLLSVEIEERTLLIKLSDTDKTLTDAQFSLACACLTTTCLELADVDTVTITSGERSVSMNRDSLLLFDDIDATETTTEVTQ